MSKQNQKTQSPNTIARQMYRDYIDTGAQTEEDFLRLGYLRDQIANAKDAFAQLMRSESAMAA